MTWVICVANEKGGVAKTTTTVSIGAAFAETGKKVLLVDLDPQANLTLALGADPSRIKATITNMFLEGVPLRDVLVDPGIPGLTVVPSNHDATRVEHVLTSRPAYEFTLRNSLAVLNTGGNVYDVIIIDCPPMLGTLTINAINAAELLLIPTQAEFFSINSLRTMMNYIRQIRSLGNPNLNYRLLVTMLDRRNRIHRSLLEQLRTTFGKGVLDTVIELDTRLREAALAGVPITTFAPQTRSAMQYRTLTAEISAYLQK